jgi:O-antigen/teichoic acid export membrane protein
MSSIRKQSILSTLVIYGGFGIGLLNTYLFTRKDFFTQEEFGLYNAFIAITLLLVAIGNLGAPYFIYKFFPYYRDRTTPGKNDQLTIAFILGMAGFVLLFFAGQLIEPLIIRKYATNSPLLIQYFNWIYALAGGLLLFNILEAWGWQQKESVISNFLKEGFWRLLVLLLIIFFIKGWISSFTQFVKLFSFSYLIIGLLLFIYLYRQQKLPLPLQVSTLTIRLKRPLFNYTSFTYAGTLIFVVAQVFDSILIPSVLENALAQLAIYSLAQNMASMLQAPQRGMIAAAMEPLTSAWKQKDQQTLQRIYQRSSINLFLFGVCFFGLFAINYQDAIITLQLKPAFLSGFTVFLLLGITRLIDMGTGINSQLIVTSPRWRFEFISGVILLLSMLPLSYFLTKSYGIVGTAIAQLISISIYNCARVLFLWLTFKLQPFSYATLKAILLFIFISIGIHLIFKDQQGWLSLFGRSALYLASASIGVIYLKLTPDIKPVLQSIKKRLIKS